MTEQLTFPQINSVRTLMSYGFNNTQIAKRLKLHRVTIQRYAKELQRQYDGKKYRKTNSEETK